MLHFNKDNIVALEIFSMFLLTLVIYTYFFVLFCWHLQIFVYFLAIQVGTFSFLLLFYVYDSKLIFSHE